MPTATINGIEIYFERGGEGPPVLFLNGSGATLAGAAPLIDRLRSSLDVVAHDQRGLGKTEIPEGPYSMADYAADALGLMDYVGWARCRVVGVSFGGMVAQELAVTAPERVERLALVCTSPGGEGGASYPLHELTSLSDEERAAISVSVLDTRFTPDWLAEHPLDAAIVNARGRVEAKSDEQRYGELAQLEARRHHDVSSRLGAITSPTLVAYGEYDGIAPKANSEYIAKHIVGAELRGYEGGHLFFIQDKTALPDVIGFLSQD
jgi:pimeloyl-ACP methyl ester carboxylesterase